MNKTFPSSNKFLKGLFVLFFFFQPFRDLRFISFLSFQDILMTISLVIMFFTRQLRFSNYRISIYTLISCILISLTTMQYSVNHAENLLNTGKVFFAYGLVSCYLINFAQEHRDYLRLASYGLTSGLAVTIFFSIIESQNSASAERLIGFSGHTNYLAFSGIMCISLVLFFETSKLHLQFFRIIGVTLGLITTILTTSNTAILALFVVILLKFSGNRFRILTIPFVGLTSLFAFKTFSIFEDARQRLEGAITQRYSYSVGGLGNNSLQDRIYTSLASLERISSNPFFGYGLDLDGRITSTGIETHNYLLLSWQTGGIFFLIFQLVITFILCQRALERPFNKQIICIYLCIFAFLNSEPWIYERSITCFIFLVYFHKRYKRPVS